MSIPPGTPWSPALQHWQQAGRFVSVLGRRIFVRVGGSGPALLLIHGYPVGSYNWHALWPRLAPHFSLVAPDMVGHGFSDKPLDGDYSLTGHAAMHEALLTQLGIARCNVVAFDLGVSVLQEMLARRPSRPEAAQVGAVVLLNGGVCPRAYQPRLVQRLLVSPVGAWLGPRVPRRWFEQTIVRMYGQRPPPDAALLDDFWALLNHGQGRRVAHRVGAFWQERLALADRLLGALLRSGVRLRLINGAADPNSGAHMVRAFLQHRPDADVVSLDGIGHWPQIQAVDPVAQAIQAFLRPDEALTASAAPEAQPADATTHRSAAR